jgi:hypothetical protein
LNRRAEIPAGERWCGRTDDHLTIEADTLARRSFPQLKPDSLEPLGLIEDDPDDLAHRRVRRHPGPAPGHGELDRMSPVL